MSLKTTLPLSWSPSAADGVSLTPNASAWVNSSWVELTPSTGGLWTLYGVMLKPGVTNVEFEIDIGVGAAGSELVFATHRGIGESASVTGDNWNMPFGIPITGLPASTRVAVRLRKAGTSTTAWRCALGYYQGVIGASNVTTKPQQTAPSAADGVALTANASAWTAGSWVQLVASFATDVLVVGFAIDRGNSVEFEMEFGTGGAGSEVVKTRVRGSGADGSSAAGNSLTFLMPPLKITSGTRLAARVKVSGGGAITHHVAVLFYEAEAGAEFTTAELKVVPAAGTLRTSISLNSINNWANTSWTQMIASTGSAIVVVGVTVEPNINHEIEIDVGTGGAGSEVVIGTLRLAERGTDEHPVHHYFPVPIDNVGSGVRVAVRARRHGTDTSDSLAIGLLYLDGTGLSGFTATTGVATTLPAAANGARIVFTPSSEWENSAWVEIVAATASALVIGAVVAYPESSLDTNPNLASGSEIEIDIGVGAAGSEAVITTIRLYDGVDQSFPLCHPLKPLLDNVASGVRLACRLRKDGTTLASYRVAVVAYAASVLVSTLQKVTQIVVQMGIDEDPEDDPPPDTTPCTGGGTVATGTNPSAGTSLATASVIHKWLEVMIGATTYRWSDVAINWTTAKEPRVLAWGRAARGLTDGQGGPETAAMTIRLADADRVLRGLHSSSTLLNKVATVYAADEATIKAGGTPWTIFAGAIRDFRPESELTYRLVLEDALTLSMSAFAQERLVPSYLIGNQISDQNPVEKVWDAPAQIAYGSLSDEDDADPIGTVLCPFIAAETIAEAPELGNMSKFLVCRGASHDVQAVFIGDPTSGSPPTARTKAGASEYGTRIFVPHQAGWVNAFQYYEQDSSRRWTYIYVIGAHPGQEQARLKRIPVVANICARETTGDATGSTIDSLPLQFLHFLNNEVVQDATGNWLTIKALGSYSLFDTSSFTTVKTRSEARISGGYKGAFLLGYNFQQVTLRAAIAQFCRSGDFDLGVNRFGQLMLTMLDRTSTASAATVFTDEHDILKDSFQIDPKADEVENKIRYVYKRNYVPALQDLNPDTGTRLPREPFDTDWLSGLQTVSDATSIANIGETRESQLLELEMVREAATAADVAAQRLALRKNPRAVATFAVTIAAGAGVELGDIVKVTHFQGIGASGWTARRLQVRRIEVDLDRLTIALTCRDVHDLLA